jgi:DNA-binding Lrp family transcriptional regulator
MREIARRAGLAVATVQRELKILLDAGLVERTQTAQHVLYRPAGDSRALPALRMLLGLDDDPVAEVAEKLKTLGTAVEWAFFTADPKSASGGILTLVVVGSARFEDVYGLVAPIEARQRWALRLLVLSSGGFAKQAERYELSQARVVIHGGPFGLMQK